MEKLDAFLVDRLDAVTAKLQRRGVMFAASGTCWLRACRFLGPGEFAKNRKTAHGGQYARQNQGG